MTAMLPFGVLLRRWRQNRRLSQEALALAAGSSTRHLSCLETARSQPSREMILRLAEQLEIPLDMRRPTALRDTAAYRHPPRHCLVSQHHDGVRDAHRG